MLVKSFEPLEAINDTELRLGGSSTPHRINMTTNSTNTNNNEEEEADIASQSTMNITNKNCNAFKLRVSKKRLGKQIATKTSQQCLLGIKVQKSSEIVKKNTQTLNNHKLTDFFPVRRSIRKCKKTVLEEIQRDIENKIRRGVEDGLQVRYFGGKGRGVVTTRDFVKGEFVVEYIGDLIEQNEAKRRETKYAKDQNTGCYMYYFQHKNSQYCVDATAESEKLGRLVNHSRNGNLLTKIVEVDKKPHLVLIAKDDIPAGTEVCYDYGDRNKESIRNHPWLAF